MITNRFFQVFFEGLSNANFAQSALVGNPAYISSKIHELKEEKNKKNLFNLTNLFSIFKFRFS